MMTLPPPGSLATTDVAFDILEDGEFEGDESITLALTLVGPARLGTSEHIVTIRDNDGENFCSLAQIEVQQAVGDFALANYRNKGAQMKLINQILKRFELGRGQLPEGCRGCIVSQFARGILIAEQAQCTSSYLQQ